MLKVYLENLEEAGTRGRNLLSKKYARMDNLIPLLSDNPANTCSSGAPSPVHRATATITRSSGRYPARPSPT